MNKILHGDSIEVLKTLEPDSVDLVCTDPPYGYSFMGKSWDKALPDIGIFKECLRVLKPGAFAFVMSAPRSDVCARMMMLLEDSGFDIGFTPVYHTYASGFPKAQNVHKKLTKDEAARQHDLQELWRTVIHSTSSPEQSIDRASLSSLLADLERGEQREISAEDLSGKETQVSDRQAKSCLERWGNLSTEKRKLWGCEVCTMPRAILINGKKRWLCYGAPSSNGGFAWEAIAEDGSRASYQSRLHGQRAGKLDALCVKCRAQTIRTFDGAFSGFQPKPAVEVIIVAMKPLSEKTFVDQALKNGKGITWLDDARIPVEGHYAGAGGRGAHGRGEGYGFKPTGLRTVPVHSKDKKKDETIWGLHPTIQHERVETSLGRFPANLLVSDDVLNDGRITKSTVDKSSHAGRAGTSTFAGDEQVERIQRGDSGSYSRYFSLDAWAKTLPFLIVPKASKREKNGGLQNREDETVGDGRPIAIDNAFQRGKTERKNIHPTVKPLTLMSYLITLGSRPADIVLDPFLGSGTTAIAAKQLGRNYLGIEREDEYVKIAEARIAAVAPSLL